jgi:hypothetical protein
MTHPKPATAGQPERSLGMDLFGVGGAAAACSGG